MLEDFFGWFLYWVILFPFVFMIPHIILNAATEGKFMPYSIALRVLFSLGMGYYEMKEKEEKIREIRRKEKEEREKAAKNRK